MILTLAGLHGSGKSYFSSYIATKFGWSVYVKRDLLKLLHDNEGGKDDWVVWYREIYASIGPYEVMKRILNFIPFSNRLILDSIHNIAEWKAVKECRPDAILSVIIAPKAVRIARNKPDDKLLDIQRVNFWHDDNNSCLIAESEWCFNGAASSKTQNAEFEAFLAHYAID